MKNETKRMGKFTVTEFVIVILITCFLASVAITISPRSDLRPVLFSAAVVGAQLILLLLFILMRRSGDDPRRDSKSEPSGKDDSKPCFRSDI